MYEQWYHNNTTKLVLCISAAGVVHWQTEIWRWWWIFVCGCCQRVNTTNMLNISDWLIAGSAHLLPTLLPPVWSRLRAIFYLFVIKMCVPLTLLSKPLLGNKTISLQYTVCMFAWMLMWTSRYLVFSGCGYIHGHLLCVIVATKCGWRVGLRF